MFEHLSKNQDPIQAFDVKALKAKQDNEPPEPCPYFVEPAKPKPGYEESNKRMIGENEVFIRKTMFAIVRFIPTYIIWVDDLKMVLEIFDKSMMICEQKFDAGVYNPQAKFLFVVDQNDKDLSRIFSYRFPNLNYPKKYHNFCCICRILKFLKFKKDHLDLGICTANTSRLTNMLLWYNHYPMALIKNSKFLDMISSIKIQKLSTK